jgi:hypothetical protein
MAMNNSNRSQPARFQNLMHWIALSEKDTANGTLEKNVSGIPLISFAPTLA